MRQAELLCAEPRLQRWPGRQAALGHFPAQRLPSAQRCSWRALLAKVAWKVNKLRSLPCAVLALHGVLRLYAVLVAMAPACRGGLEGEQL